MAELLSAVADLLWPILLAIAILLFARPLAGLIRSGANRDDVTFEIGGQKITFGKLREQQNAITSDLQQQVARLQTELADLRGTAEGAPVPVPEADTPPTTSISEGRTAVLWVDDNPENNALIIDQLRTAGTTVDLARSSKEALRLAASTSYRVVISDMGRGFDNTAGVKLVRELKDAGLQLPIIIFAGPRGVRQHAEEARRAGADQVTASATELATFLRSHGVLT
jgi:CheY-like chemotaxis protein